MLNVFEYLPQLKILINRTFTQMILRTFSKWWMSGTFIFTLVLHVLKLVITNGIHRSLSHRYQSIQALKEEVFHPLLCPIPQWGSKGKRGKVRMYLMGYSGVPQSAPRIIGCLPQLKTSPNSPVFWHGVLCTGNLMNNYSLWISALDRLLIVIADTLILPGKEGLLWTHS